MPHLVGGDEKLTAEIRPEGLKLHNGAVLRHVQTADGKCGHITASAPNDGFDFNFNPDTKGIPAEVRTIHYDRGDMVQLDFGVIVMAT